MTTNTDTQTKSPVKKKKSPVGKVILLLFILILAAGAVLYFQVPQKIGLAKSPAEDLFTVTPDREKAAAVMEDLAAAGLNTRGVEVYVLPVSGTDHSVAMIVLDASKGFDFNSFGGTDPVKDLLAVVSKAQQEGIDRAAVAYYDEEGKQLMTATVPADAVLAYSEGKLTDQQLMEAVDVGTDDIAALIGDLQEQLK